MRAEVMSWAITQPRNDHLPPDPANGYWPDDARMINAAGIEEALKGTDGRISTVCHNLQKANRAQVSYAPARQTLTPSFFFQIRCSLLPAGAPRPRLHLQDGEPGLGYEMWLIYVL